MVEVNMVVVLFLNEYYFCEKVRNSEVFVKMFVNSLKSSYNKKKPVNHSGSIREGGICGGAGIFIYQMGIQNNLSVGT
jgi:hypothetical protein